MEGSHSPFGYIWQIATATGWTIDYILWKIPYTTLLLMLSDAPRMVKDGKQKSPSQPGSNARQAMDILSQLQAHENAKNKKT